MLMDGLRRKETPWGGSDREGSALGHLAYKGWLRRLLVCFLVGHGNHSQAARKTLFPFLGAVDVATVTNTRPAGPASLWPHLVCLY